MELNELLAQSAAEERETPPFKCFAEGCNVTRPRYRMFVGAERGSFMSCGRHVAVALDDAFGQDVDDFVMVFDNFDEYLEEDATPRA